MSYSIKMNGFKRFLIFIFSFFIFPWLLTSACSDRQIPAKKSQGQPEYACLVESAQKKIESLEGENFELRFRIKNQGKAVLSSQGKNPCFFSYHLLDEKGRVIKYNNRRYVFSRDIFPSETAELSIQVKAPLEKARYMLEFDVVREGVAWLKDCGSKSFKILLQVHGHQWPEESQPLSLDYGKYTKIKSSRDEFNKLLKIIRITLEHNKITFKGKTGNVAGFSAGSVYPQIWLRDASTIIPAARYYYNLPFLRSWLEAHLSFQKETGSLEDWIDSRGWSDKNTTETDQEASAVLAAQQISQLVGPQWLEGRIKGESIINRLEKALLYVLAQRFDQRHGLITGAHTADWGDVDMAYPDQRAIYTDKQTHWTGDIYDQSIFFAASQNLAEMFKALGQEGKTRFWKEKAQSIQKNTDRWLWQKSKGFYRVHIHLDFLKHDFDEDNIFAMGGNAEAVLSGLASEEKCLQIIDCALERQKTYSVSTISGTLLPPYPKNFFRHSLLDDTYEYQNGGQWDWFGGKLILAMFEHGFSRQAREKLLEIAKKNLANRGLFEWDSREGTGQGSDFYSGSAGSLARALFEGYLGFKLSKDFLCIAPKLERDSAIVHVYIPAADFSAAYDYRFDREKNKLYLAYNSNFPRPGKIQILNPWFSPGQASAEGEPLLEVRKDGVKIPYLKLRINRDESIVIETDFKRHLLEISFRPKPS